MNILLIGDGIEGQDDQDACNHAQKDDAGKTMVGHLRPPTVVRSGEAPAESSKEQENDGHMGDPMMASYFLHPIRDALASLLRYDQQGIQHCTQRQRQPE